MFYSVFLAFVSLFVSVIFICLSDSADRLFIYLSCFSAYFSALDQDVLMRMPLVTFVTKFFATSSALLEEWKESHVLR